MADGVPITAGTGTTIATDDVGGQRTTRSSSLRSGRLTRRRSSLPRSALPIEDARADTATLANVAGSRYERCASSSTRATRLGLILFNDSTASCYVKYGATASATSFTVFLGPGAYWEMPKPIWTGTVDGIWTSAAGNMRVTELTPDMPLFDRPPIDAISVSNSLFSSGTFRITGGPQITVGSDASGAVLSAGVVGSFFENAIPDPSSAQTGLALASVNTNMAGGRLLVQPISPSNELFPMNITVTRADLNFSGSATTSSTNLSQAFTSSFMLGFYTRSNSTRIDLMNSVLLSTAAGAVNSQLQPCARGSLPVDA